MSAESVSPQPAVSPLEAFHGTIQRSGTGPLYQAGLAIVAFSMVLLPLIYLALIGLTVWAVIWHLLHDTWVFDGGTGRGGLMRLLLYITPAVVGGIMVFFMVKPFFARTVKPPDPITLDPAQEPLLFEFVKKICAMVGAPVPCRIDVDCEVNASASLRRGWWSRDLVLTIGLPLVAGLNMRQFAGVLAHEFGHFAQGAGLRLTYIIRRINHWFARVVYERDEWDVKLNQAASDSDWRIAIMLHIARGCVWVTRRILWALMHAGNAISCFMMRQMEFDADSYETKIAGSDAFESTAGRLRLLGVATQSAYHDVQQSWASKRLPENLPLLIGHKAGTLPAEVHQKLAESAGAEKTNWFDTHPCDADRIKASRRLNQPGVFQLANPATQLFTDFAAVSKLVTRHQYQKHLELEFTEQNLMSAEEILRESAAQEEAAAMIRKYYGKVDLALKPLWISPELPPSAAATRESWSQAREDSDRLRAEAEKFSAKCQEQQKRLADLRAAQLLTKAGFAIQPLEFGLPEHLTTSGEQGIAAGQTAVEAEAVIRWQLAAMEPFMASLRQRVTSAVTLARSGNMAPGRLNELPVLLPLLFALGAELPALHELGSSLGAFRALAEKRPNHSNPDQVDGVVRELAAEFTARLNRLNQQLHNFAYPFPHARGRLTVAEYATQTEPDAHEFIQAYIDAAAHVDRLLNLYIRIAARVLACADAWESQVPPTVEAEQPVHASV